MMTDIPITTLAIRLLLSLALAFIIGWEREVMRKPAGLRTNMLVALGATGFTLLTIQIFHAMTPEGAGRYGDPLRIINGIMEGLGFLGAGSIIQSRGSVQGITTAATIWVVGSMGLACGIGNYYLALGITILAFLVFTALRSLESYIVRKDAPK